MSIATIEAFLRQVDERYRAEFFELWNVQLDQALALCRQTFLQGTDRYRTGESYLGFATAPRSNEGAKYTYSSPQQGKETIVETEIYKFGMRASEELRDYGRSYLIEQWPQLMVNVLNNTVRVMIFNKLNRAFVGGVHATNYDGQALITTAHPLGNATLGFASNALATPADLGETTLEALIELLGRTPNETGVPTGQFTPSLLITGGGSWGDAERVTKSQYTQAPTSIRGPNTISAITSRYGIRTMAHPMISDGDASYLMDSAQTPLNVVWARLPRLREAYIEQGTDDWVWEVKMQLKVIADNWRGIVGSPGAD
jgi:hypothetical protein